VTADLAVAWRNLEIRQHIERAVARGDTGDRADRENLALLPYLPEGADTVRVVPQRRPAPPADDVHPGRRP
jgi:hypothetical protein